MRIIGIDPGLSGAVAILDDLKVFDIPHPLKLKKPTLIPHYYYRPTSFLNLLKRYIKLFLIFLGILDKKYTGKYYDGLKV